MLQHVEFHDHVNPVLLRQDVGRRLRAAREEVDLTVIDVGAHLDLAPSTVSRIETGWTVVNTTVAQAMMQLYKLDDDELLDLVRRSRKPGWWRQYSISDHDFIALESGASRLSTYQPDLIHGLLQTADYAHALFSAGMQTRTKRWTDKQLDVRMIRQERLADENYPLALEVVIGEIALCRPVGGRDVMRTQLRHLALITELPTVSVRILPTSVVSSPAMYGAFSILDFPTIQPSMVYVEHAIGTERTEKEERVGKTRLRYNHLRSLALDPKESVSLIERWPTRCGPSEWGDPMSTVDLSGARWRKSSRSNGEENSDCVEIALVAANWRKSSFSGGEENSECVEVAFAGPAAALRDSKNPAGPVLVLPATSFRHCLSTVAAR